MSTLRLRSLPKPPLASRVWRPWAAAPKYSQELRVLEEVVAAARFGVNSPHRLIAPSGHEDVLERRVQALP